ncbi:MAG: membrane integrity-associated transporter subunit PqiC [Deltaproteobacteria bacterium]|nr:membrane integrity-associated transporter subunit PqiC [Deltaproteobacteria bacterium]
MPRFGRNLVCALFLATALSGCPFRSIRDQPAPALYLLSYDGELETSTLPKNKKRLMVTETTSSRLINSQKILIKNPDRTISYYKLASWAEPPPTRFTTLLLSQLDKSEAFEDVIRSSGAAQADYVINCEMLELFHETAAPPGKVNAEVRCDLINLASRQLVGSHYFRESRPLDSFDAAAAAEASNSAVSGIVSRVIKWSAATVQR